MQKVCVEFVVGEAVVYRPGTSEVVTTTPSLKDALAFARAEWPNLGVRVILSKNAGD